MNSLERLLRTYFTDERRRSRRYALMGPVMVRVKNCDTAIKTFGIDVSENGVLLQMDTCLPEGTCLSVAVRLPTISTNPKEVEILRGIARVVRVELNGGKYETAVEFDSVELTKDV